MEFNAVRGKDSKPLIIKFIPFFGKGKKNGRESNRPKEKCNGLRTSKVDESEQA